MGGCGRGGKSLVEPIQPSISVCNPRIACGPFPQPDAECGAQMLTSGPALLHENALRFRTSFSGGTVRPLTTNLRALT